MNWGVIRGSGNKNTMNFSYHAFISYSHAADSHLAPALQGALQRLGKPWWRPPTVKIFRDQTSLAANAALWPEIERQLARCAWFILMASPQAASSPWVAREVRWWLEHRDAERILIVVSEGEIAWDEQRRDFDWSRTTCLPADLGAKFLAEPLYIDLRWARSPELLTLNHPKFRDAVLTLAAPLHGCDKDELDSEDIRQHRRLRRAALGAATLIGALTLAAILAGWGAWRATGQAEANWREARSRLLAGKAIHTLEQERNVQDAIKVALMAWSLAPTDEAKNALEKIGAETSAMAGMLGQHAAGLVASVFSDNSRRLATLGNDGAIQLWRVDDWQPDGSMLEGKLSKAQGLVFDAPGQHLLAWAKDGAAELWDLSTRNKLTFVIPGWVEQQRTIGALSSGGQFVALVDGKYRLHLWDVRMGKQIVPPSGLTQARIIGVAFRGEDKLMAILRDRTVRIATWNLPGQQVIQGPPTAEEHHLAYADRAQFAAASPRFLVEGHGTATVFEIGSRLELRLIESIQVSTSACPPGVVLDAPGTTLYTATMLGDGWQRRDLSHPGSVEDGGKATRFSCSDWSPDGRWHVETLPVWGDKGRTGGSLLIWDLSQAKAPQQTKSIDAACDFSRQPDHCIRRLCEKLTPVLNEAELQKLFGIENYEVMYDRYRKTIGGPLCAMANRE